MQEDRHRPRPSLGPEERKRIQRANQIFLRLKKQLHDREGEFAEKDVGEAARGAQWLQEVVERHPEGLEEAYEDALAGSGLPEEDQTDLRNRIEEAGGFSSFVLRDLRRLQEAVPDEGEPSGDSGPASVTHQDLGCCIAAGPVAGGTMMGNAFYFGFAVGMSRKNEC